jgi:hypothetical protein
MSTQKVFVTFVCGIIIICSLIIVQLVQQPIRSSGDIGMSSGNTIVLSSDDVTRAVFMSSEPFVLVHNDQVIYVDTFSLETDNYSHTADIHGTVSVISQSFSLITVRFLNKNLELNHYRELSNLFFFLFVICIVVIVVWLFYFFS